jgi:HAAS
MGHPDPVAEYLRTLRRHLDIPDPDRVLDEIATHIDDAVATEMAAGLDRASATSLVLARMGPPEALARGYRTSRPLTTSLVVIAAIATAFVAVWLVMVTTMVLPRRDPAGIPFWTGVTVGFSLYLILMVVSVGVGRRSRFLRLLTTVASLGAIAIGAAWIVTMFTRTDDFEGYIVLLGVVLIFDGAAFLTSVVARGRGARQVAR